MSAQRVADLLIKAADLDARADEMRSIGRQTAHDAYVEHERAMRVEAAGYRCEALVLQLQDWRWPDPPELPTFPESAPGPLDQVEAWIDDAARAASSVMSLLRRRR